jgi:hypothetical protein
MSRPTLRNEEVVAYDGVQQRGQGRGSEAPPRSIALAADAGDPAVSPIQDAAASAARREPAPTCRLTCRYVGLRADTPSWARRGGDPLRRRVEGAGSGERAPGREGANGAQDAWTAQEAEVHCKKSV